MKPRTKPAKFATVGAFISVLGSKLGKESASQIRPEPTPQFRQLTPANHQSAHAFGPKTGEKSCEFDTTVEKHL
jgi:hypothetical protein